MRRSQQAFALAIVSATAALVITGCHHDPAPQLTRVDLIAENQPPIPVKASSAGITISEGIGVAFTISGYVDDKPSKDILQVRNDTTCTLVHGYGAGEYFLVGGAPGTGTLEITDSPGAEGSIKVPVTVVAQTP